MGYAPNVPTGAAGWRGSFIGNGAGYGVHPPGSRRPKPHGMSCTPIPGSFYFCGLLKQFHAIFGKVDSLLLSISSRSFHSCLDTVFLVDERNNGTHTLLSISISHLFLLPSRTKNRD